ncbi:hypothetical protein COU62_03825 [Candidatus Pacearchaeota archaeon CG10_big_fil_rev_8_21_14_0_10_35_219]|nr:hypothetical protein [Candidatus Pacearchaeota archaeon]OIO42286.1 MAG: hypothetical protein AUJ63_03345 [Candidatus Pacearchaeota archaeon CG1_02_35_32]PIO07480.1 MAG: hypothetical protein COU62_03825 [Candidatus Pacearchaeota archaeon CG10_big_fil_rev_8_21_14_0_10_35_219]PIY81286.1 MAG: hypothetical protein COY79_03320 [Candidatus Pacearchaeota archaeon CG_4_10_14_0_8_um_filter_35_169]PIZ80215.1 MAG: hypothetical protein COY00_01965 [Candidatus Pacearchaeota archaeon CG_4_10_14_0_2_um_filt
MEEGERPIDALVREMKEGLPDLGLDEDYVSQRMEHRIYNWKEDVTRVLEEAQEVFQRNMGSFLGLT